MTIDDNATTNDSGGARGPEAGLAAALTREHHDIDTGIEALVASLGAAAPLGSSQQAAPLLTAMRALRRHIYLEEVFLFPPIQAAGMTMPILVMLREHGQLWRATDTLTDLLSSLSADPADAAISEQFSARCQELLAMLDEHNRKEEPIIYPHAESDLTDDARAELAAFLQSGHTPEGWSCQRASQ